MIARRLSEVAAAVGGRVVGEDVTADSVTTDSRLATPGALFIALKGEHVDGHDFVSHAAARGAVAAVVSRSVEHGPLVEVDDTGRALLSLAADERRRLVGTTVVGVTGANGKTSTKDLAAAVLATRFRTHASPRSFNNEIGLPMTLLGAPPNTEVIVAEMGARRVGDVGLLCDVAQPRIVVITNVGVAHLGIFGSWEQIVEASAEPLRSLAADGIAVLNADDPIVRGYAAQTRARVIWFGAASDADVRMDDVALGDDGRATFTLVAGGAHGSVELGVPGEHMVPNAVAAAACGMALGLTAEECAAALKGATVSAWRMETFITSDGVVVVNDAYNANPESMAAALKAARWIARNGRLAAVLGHMAELGPITLEEHERLGELVVRVGVDRLIAVGEEARMIHRAAVREGQLPEDAAAYDTSEEALEDLRDWCRPGDVVLCKGSRVVGLERLAEALR